MLAQPPHFNVFLDQTGEDDLENKGILIKPKIN